MKKRILSMLLVLVMLLGLLPVSAFAEGNPITASITMTAQANGQFLCDPQFGLTVTSDLAEQLDYYDEVDPNTAVSALDALVAAHYLIYEDAFAENPTDYLDHSNGWVTKAFGQDSPFGFWVNGTAASTGGLEYDPWSFEYMISQAPIKDGDKVDFWLYQDAGYGDYYLSFRDMSANMLTSLSIPAGGTVDFQVMGCSAMSGSVSDEYKLANGMLNPMGGIELAVVQADGTELPIRSTDDGYVTSFGLGDTPGEYLLVAYANSSCQYKVIKAVIPVTVVSTNHAPTLTGSTAASADAEVGSAYTLDLGTVFFDADGDTLTYKVSVNGAAAVAAEKSYSYIPDEQGTVTLAFTANDGKADSPAYTVTLNVETAKARLQSLIVHTSTSPSDTNVLIKNAADSYANGITFDPNTLTYNLTVASDTSNQLRFRALAANPGDKVTLHYGDNQTKDITWTSGSSKWANCLSVGRNELKLEVTGEGRETVTYTLIVDQLPTLTGITASTDKGNAYWGEKFAATTYDYTLKIPADATTVTLTGTPKSSGVTVTYNGSEANTVDVTNTDTIEVKLSAGEVSRTYTVTLVKAPNEAVNFQVTPGDAVVKVYDAEGNSIAANADGSFSGLFGAMEYTYTVTKYGYVAATGTVPAEGGTVVVELTKAADSDLADVDAYWPSFRGDESNQAITDALTPIDPEKTELLWNKLGGSGWSDAPSVQIIVDNALVVLVNKNIYKLDLQTGEVLAQGTMVAKSSYGFTAPVYAEGMIICALTGGKVQAFDAKTLESLWVYTDPRGGQDQVPVIYSDGYVYTGFWNGENKLANFVCLSITDEDPTKTDEAKTATWIHTQLGGFYWAGAAVVGDAVIVGTDDGESGTTGTSYVYSFNKYTGNVISKLELTGMGDQRSTMAYDAETSRVYFTTKGGYLCRADVNAATGELSNLKAVNNQAQSTSTPVVYKGKVYYGVGSGISSTGSSGNLVVADAESLEMLYVVGLKGYPQASALLSTGYEKSTGYIYLYITYNSNPGGISMVKIDPTKDTADGAQLMELYDAEGFNQYCICSIICGPDGTLYYKNDSRNVLAVASPAENAVMTLIDAIGDTVTLDSEEVITIARNAYDALTEGEKAKVTNYAELTAAENKLAQLKQDVADKAAADAVITKINAIGTVTKDSEAAIQDARAAYDALTDAQKLLVSNYKTLTDAESALAALKAEDNTKPTDPEDTRPTDPEDTTKPTTPADPSTPQTGDNTNIALYTTLMITSLACMAALLLVFKKKEGKYSR